MFKDIPNVVVHHYKEGNINWPMLIYISLVHVVAVVGLFTIHKCSAETLLWAFILWPVRYVSISCLREE
jgi:stearoyl-CoA desaturase (Delta-9 desaturase)